LDLKSWKDLLSGSGLLQLTHTHSLTHSTRIS
jgi:hypothetical protein